MLYFPIAYELFHSDSVLFFILGLLVAAGASKALKRSVTALKAILSVGIVYCLSESFVILLPHNDLVEILLVIIGTAALGAAAGFSAKLIALIRAKRKKQEKSIRYMTAGRS
ncbi:MAG: hypothetical protein J6M17_00675 [Ruminococcus sp.]|jgi:hypothetical protein|nr:hypothetical protein [Ruminococcus sp.]